MLQSDIDEVPLELDEFLYRQTDYGCMVKDLELQNGHYLVWKIPMAAQSKGEEGKPIDLPDNFRRRQIGNLVAILGFVVASPSPFRAKHAKRYWKVVSEEEAALDQLPGLERPRYKVRNGIMASPQVQPGEAIVYNSYNLGFIEAYGLHEPLAIIREVDVLARFPASRVEDYELGDFALTRSYNPH
jgi:hypothetical protein